MTGITRARFSEVREAFETLNDPGRRMAYDDALKNYKSYNPQVLPQKLKYTRVTRGIDIGFSFTLIVLTLIFGDFVYKSLYSVTTTDVVKHTVVAPVLPVAAVNTRHHKKKHGFKLKDTSGYYAQNINLSKPVTVADTRLIKPWVCFHFS